MTADFVVKTTGARKKWQTNLEYWRKRTFSQKLHTYPGKIHFLTEGEMKAFFGERKSFCYKQTYQNTTAKSCSLNKKWRRKWENVGHQEEKEKKASKIIINTIEFLSLLSFVSYALWMQRGLSYLYLVRLSFPYLSRVSQTPSPSTHPQHTVHFLQALLPIFPSLSPVLRNEERIPHEATSPLGIKGRLLMDSTFQRN